jgi:hypothetical protein
MERLITGYRERIEDDELEDMLLNIENVPVIEELMYRESRRVERLRGLVKRGELRFGRKIKQGEMRELLPEVCREVNNFLGVMPIEPVDIPNAEYYNIFNPKLKNMLLLTSFGLSEAAMIMGAGNMVYGDAMNPKDIFLLLAGGAALFRCSKEYSDMKCPKYNAKTKKIILQKTSREKLIPIIAHEYAHHIQRRRGINKTKWSIFTEGHARGVQRKISKIFSERENNEAFIYQISEMDMGEYKKAYRFMCEELGITANESLMRTKTRLDRYRNKEINSHQIGNSLFSILEEKHGDGIYKKMIHGNFNFS